MIDFTICIAHRGDPLGLFCTISSCEADLADSKYSWNYVIVCNGSPKLTPVEKNMIHFLTKGKKLKRAIVKIGNLSPPNARQLAASHADGEILFFLDNHCVVGKNYFARAMADFKHYGAAMDMLHSVTVFHPGEYLHYHYHLTLQKNFWATSCALPDNTHKPYRIAVAGHGGFAIRRSVWDEVGGYWDGFVGYGGEEVYLDMKLALLGKKNWIDPLLVHYHYAGARAYPRHYTDDYFRNMMMCANIIGGYDWMMRVYNNFRSSTRVRPRCSPDETMFDLLLEAYDRSKAHADHMASIRLRTLDEQLTLFREESVAYT
jgi:hypothetical protein